ncbi:translesion error-prone DNA polymerase V subunit UmuC [Aliamphritea ceti]|uniref:translesion error-prone DNA polymerase V subunit UmuC n=1 Tax=Aliamphritea ceti TaxID=1524258 RepID=UPI0021C269A2|nr:translesion error-prone DNA polymerase V subunit UmuC [Aliamphritea ceti]
MSTPCFALVDCNNFYASCERLFRPDLRNRPIVVLSNNDGCIVARSSEAKALGITMAVPLFQVQEILDREQVTVFSSNYALYGDISARVMSLLEQLAPATEVYSIDEAFLDFTGIKANQSLDALGSQIKQQIADWVGIPVCVGIAPTKTLAKLANHAAKAYPKTNGVVDLTDPARQQRLLRLLPADEVWGVGRRTYRRLQTLNIHTAWQLACCNTAWIRKEFSVTLERTVRELQGQSCFDLEDQPPPRQQILCSRSFAKRITEYSPMHAAICQYTARAAEKLREQDATARLISIFIRTSPHSHNSEYYSPSASHRLSVPSNDTRILVAAAIKLLNNIWQEGHRFIKAGIILTDLYTAGSFQPTLFDQPDRRNSKALMETLDRINHSGLGKICFAGEQLSQGWQMQRNKLSPAYTTRWHELPIVKA